MDRLVEATVNASVPARVDAARLAACLRGEADLEPWLPHLQAFFTELSLDSIEAFAAGHGVTPAALGRVYAAVVERTGDVAPDVEDWLRYLEDAPSAGAPGA